jgi:fatty acid synthase subunit beta
MINGKKIIKVETFNQNGSKVCFLVHFCAAQLRVIYVSGYLNRRFNLSFFLLCFQVVEGTAEIDQPTIAYVFTGQGSQEQGMGMALYDSSPVAKDIWQRADRHFLENYGMYILSFQLLDVHL